MSATVWGKWFWADWLADPGLRACSVGARGIWMDMLCIAGQHDPIGYVAIAGRKIGATEIARLTGTQIDVVQQAVDELAANNVFSRTREGVIYSRRMIRDARRNDSDTKRTNGKKGGNPTLRRGKVPKSDRFRPYRRSDSPQKTLRIFQKSDGNCHWCGVGLVWEPTGSDIPPNLFHVDHLLAICDGGDNSEINLVAACAKCNHERAKLPKYQTDPNLFNSDTKRGKPPTISPMDTRARPSTCQNPDKNFPSSDPEYEQPTQPAQSKINGHPPTPSGPATALPEGRAGPLVDGSEASKTRKKPSELTKAEFEEQITKRRTGGP